MSRRAAVSSRSLLLRLVDFGRGCAGVLPGAVADVWVEPRGRTVSSGSLLLRLVVFGRGCAGALPGAVADV